MFTRFTAMIDVLSCRDVDGVEPVPDVSAHCGGMTTMPEVLPSPPSDDDLVLRLATAAYLGRFTGISRMHTESDLRLFFAWCARVYR